MALHLGLCKDAKAQPAAWWRACQTWQGSNHCNSLNTWTLKNWWHIAKQMFFKEHPWFSTSMLNLLVGGGLNQKIYNSNTKAIVISNSIFMSIVSFSTFKLYITVCYIWCWPHFYLVFWQYERSLAPQLFVVRWAFQRFNLWFVEFSVGCFWRDGGEIRRTNGFIMIHPIHIFLSIYTNLNIYIYINKCVRVKEEKVSMSTSARLIQMLERDDHQLVGPWCLQGRNNLGNCFRIFHACSIWYSTDWRLNCSFWKFVDATRFISFAPV